jgi:hypothetical protein
VRNAVEIQRFPQSRPTVPALILIGVDAPFAIEGSTSEHAILFLQYGGDFHYGSHRCVGWDLSPDPASPTHRLHAETLACIAVPADEVERVWYTNSNPLNPALGALLTSDDVGSGCFKHYNDTAVLAAVHFGAPALRHDGEQNQDQEAYATSVAPVEVRTWVDDSLFGVESDAGWLGWGEPALCSISPDTLEVFALREDGWMTWRRQEQWPSSSTRTVFIELPALEPPTTELARDRPGVLCTEDGTIQLFARGIDGSVWWQTFLDGAWADEWTFVPDTEATSGLTLMGRSPWTFDIFHRGTANQLRHGVYNGGMRWRDVGGELGGTPVVHMNHSEWWMVWAEGGGRLFDYAHWFGVEAWEGPRDEIASDPAAAYWYDDHVYVFARNAEDKLRWLWFSAFGQAPVVDTNLVLPSGSLAATARAPGRFDLLVSEPGQPIWHAWWPRDPRGN